MFDEFSLSPCMLRYMIADFRRVLLIFGRCFTPDKLRILLKSEAGAELQKSARDLFELAKGEDVAAAINSLAPVTEIVKQVDYVALQQDLNRIKVILVKVQELQAASKELPPNVPLIQQISAEMGTEVQAAQGSIERLQKTSELLSESQDDVAKIVRLSEEVQKRLTSLQPLLEPVQEIFTCLEGALENFNWTVVYKMRGDDDEGQSDWHRIFLQADENINGVLDRAEFGRINWESYGISQFEFAIMDYNASGTVDEQEWLSYKTNGAAVSQANADVVNIQSQSLAELEGEAQACKAFLRDNMCEKELREYLPRYRNIRSAIQPLTSHDWLGALKVEPKPDGALRQECELYSRVGCAAPQVQFLLRNSAGDLKKWREIIDDGETRLNHTLDFVRVNAERIDSFATGTFLWATIVGNVIALVSTLLLILRLGIRFKAALRKLRSGHPEGKIMMTIKEQSGITAIQIPKLVGMTLMSFWISYLIVASLATGMLCFLFGPWLAEVLFSNVGDTVIRFAGETLIVILISVVGLDIVMGKKMLLGGTDEMMHPVLWTWYAVLMLLYNLAKGAALATTRIITMIFLNCIRFAVLDETSFPSGFQGMDPAYSAFVATLYHCNKYRNPILTSLFLRHMENAENVERERERERALSGTTVHVEKKKQEETTGSGPSQGADVPTDYDTGVAGETFGSGLADDHPPEGVYSMFSRNVDAGVFEGGGAGGSGGGVRGEGHGEAYPVFDERISMLRPRNNLPSNSSSQTNIFPQGGGAEGSGGGGRGEGRGEAYPVFDERISMLRPRNNLPSNSSWQTNIFPQAY